jgi:hypothetical protein
MNRLCLGLVLSLCVPLVVLAEDWALLLHRVAVMKNNDDPAAQQQFLEDAKRLETERPDLVQKEVAELATLYEKDPSSRNVITSLLYIVSTHRQDTSEAFAPIFPALLAHLRDPERETRAGATRVIADMRPRIPSEALDALISLVRDETHTENLTLAMAAVAKFCTNSNPAIATLQNAAAPNQPASKRAIAIHTIGQAQCKAPELLQAIAAGLKDSDPNVLLAAAQSARYFGAAASASRNDLERIASGDDHAAEAARVTLQQLPQ